MPTSTHLTLSISISTSQTETLLSFLVQTFGVIFHQTFSIIFVFLPDGLIISLLKYLSLHGCYCCWNFHFFKSKLESLYPNFSPLSTHWSIFSRDIVQVLQCVISMAAHGKSSLFSLCFPKPGYHISFSLLPFLY